MKQFKGLAVLSSLLAVCAIFYSPTSGNKDGPTDQQQLHSTKYTATLTSTTSIQFIQLATAETAVSFDRPATRSTLLVPAPLRKPVYSRPITARDNGPPNTI